MEEIKSIQEIVLEILEGEEKREIPLGRVGPIVCTKFRITKGMLDIILRELEKEGEIQIKKHSVFLKSS